MTPGGTGATRLVAPQLFAVALDAALPILLLPWVAPKFVPASVTAVPTAPEGGVRLVRLGAGAVTVKLTPLLACPPTVTTSPTRRSSGVTGATMLVAFQLVGVAAVPLKVTVLLPWVAPKF